jgi:polysaccharide biosynthesis/export protein
MSNLSLCHKIGISVIGLTMGVGSIAPLAPARAEVSARYGNVPSVNNCPLADQETPYTLGAGDRVRIDVFNVPEYSGEFLVLVDGTINLPIIGSTSVTGMTLDQATQILTSKYAPLLKRPIITVSLTALRPLKIAIAGEIGKPGGYTISQNAGAFPTMSQIIQLAGGITQAADLRNVVLKRGQFNCQSQVNMWELIQNANLSKDITLRDGDSVFIPTVNVVDPIAVRQLNNANIAAGSQTLKIAIVGEVNRPGPYTVGSEGGSSGSSATGGGGSSNPKPPTVTRAIQVAGGITSLADVREIQVRRIYRNGTEQIITVNLWQLLQGGDLNQDLFLQDGDTITIPKATNLTPIETTQLANANFSPDKIAVNVVGEVVRGGSISLPPNTPLNQALLAAGGFNNRSHTGSVDLIRLNPNGTVSKKVIAVDFSQGVNEKTNPIMRNNDVILVRKSATASVTDTLGTILSPIGSFFSLFNFFRIFQ